MKKILFIGLLLLIFIPKVEAIQAESYVVMDYDTGRILEGKNEDKEKLIASTTKIMTAIIALENGSLDSTIKVGEEVLKAYGSAIYLSLNEEISLKDLLYGLMLRSGNDAAIEIAYLVSGNMDDFVDLMNKKSYQLGMSHTKFINNHGLENDKGEGNISTAYDMAILMRYAIKNETFRSIIATKNYTAKTSGKTYTWKNKNKLLFSYKNMLGGKTGFTEKARRTLVTASRKDEKTCIVVTLKDGNDFLDHKNLCESVFKNYERVEVVNKDNLNIDKDPMKYYIENSLYALLKPDEIDKVSVKYEITSDGNAAGYVKVLLNNELLTSARLYKREEEKSDKKENFFVRFFKWVMAW